MSEIMKFRLQAGPLVFELEGPKEYVLKEFEANRNQIEAIRAEQLKLIESGKWLALEGGGRRRGRPAKARAAKGATGRRPGRQPVIIRESDLVLKPRQLSGLKKFIESLSGQGNLVKEAAVFVIAYFLGKEVLGNDRFTAGDIIATYQQLGEMKVIPSLEQVDVVQMLRNLAASSIGKEWVMRNADGSFALTQKGKKVGDDNEIIRPRGRRPSQPAAIAVKPKNEEPKAKRGAIPGARRGRKA